MQGTVRVGDGKQMPQSMLEQLKTTVRSNCAVVHTQYYCIFIGVGASAITVLVLVFVAVPVAALSAVLFWPWNRLI